MPILIDGHNLIGRLPGLSLDDPDDEEKLVRLLVSYQARTGKAITVIFDPGADSSLPRTRRTGKVQAVFARPGGSADALIARRVRQNKQPAGLLVVTSDRALRDAVERMGARTRSAEDFVSELEADPTAPSDWRDRPPSPDEVDKWLDLFKHGNEDSIS
jgi:predicted RNA-binding protein with PIN domain